MQDPIHFAKNASLDQLTDFIKKCNDSYHNSGVSIISDNVYDIVKDILEERDPENSLIDQVGAPETGEKIKMPYYLGSMDKIKTSDGIIKFLKKYDSSRCVLSDKLDGTSGLLIIDDSSCKMYKRGDRVYGRDISYITKFMNFPKTDQKLVIRGELLISKSHYNNFKDEFSNARSMVNGIVTSKNPNEKYLKIIDFVCFEIIEPQMPPSKQFELLNKYGFKIPYGYGKKHNEILENIHDLPNSFLYKYLNNRKEDSIYDIDGIIISHDIDYNIIKEGNPKHSIAFKANSFGKITTIRNIEWNISKHGILIPRLVFDIIKFPGEDVFHATAFNAKYVIDNNLGIGSIVRIVLSGEIIPYITEIVKSTTPHLPTIDYKFNESKIHIVPVNIDDNIIHKTKRLTHFFKTLKIENISEGLIKKLINNNYDTLDKILKMSYEEFLKIDGFKETLSNKIYNNIHNVIDNPIYTELLMCASLCFGYGFGIKKLKAITNKYLDVMEREITIECITSIAGFEEKTALKFINGLVLFKKFMENHSYLKLVKLRKIKKKVRFNDGKYVNQKVVISGFRDDELVKYIEQQGGIIQSSINSQTTILIVKDKNLESSKSKSKLIKAKQQNIKILDKDELP